MSPFFFLTQRLQAIKDETHATERFLERAVAMVKHSDIKSTSYFFQVPEKNLERWYYDYVERKRATPEEVRSI